MSKTQIDFLEKIIEKTSIASIDMDFLVSISKIFALKEKIMIFIHKVSCYLLILFRFLLVDFIVFLVIILVLLILGIILSIANKFILNKFIKPEYRFEDAKKVAVIGDVLYDRRIIDGKMHFNYLAMKNDMLANEGNISNDITDIMIDALEISEGCVIYGLLINQAVLDIRNDLSRPDNFIDEIPVLIRGNPNFSAGDMKVLNHIFRNKRYTD